MRTHTHTALLQSLNPSPSARLTASVRMSEVKMSLRERRAQSEIDAAFRCLYTFPIPGCSPPLGAQLHIPSEMLSNAISPPSLEYMLMLWHLQNLRWGLVGDGFHWVLLLKQKRTHFSVLSLLKKTKHMFVPPQLVELQPAPKLLLNQ